MDPAKPVPVTEQSRQDFASFGVDLPAPDGEDEEEAIEVFVENWPIFEVFLALETQWRIIAAVGLTTGAVYYLGLDYGAAEMVLRRHGFADNDREALEHLRILEDAALNPLNGQAGGEA